VSALDWLRPERLEARWREPVPVEAEPTPAPVEDAVAWSTRLGALVVARFGAGTAIALVAEELARLVAQRFPQDGGVPVEAAELNQKIEALLTIVEDLADAAALGRRRA
jgi:hypothetical protein